MNNLNRLLTCIILSSAVMMGSLIEVRADIVFQDNFGSGSLSKWTTSGLPIIVNSPVVSGSKYAVQFPANYASQNLFYIQAEFPKSSEATLEFYFLIDTTPPVSSSVGLVQVTTIINGESGGLLSLSLDCTKNDSLGFTFIYPTGETNGIDNLLGQFIQSNVQTGSWYKVDVSIATIGNTGTIQLSVNNLPVCTITNAQFVWNPVAFRLGPLISTGYSSGNIYFDDVTITNTANIQQSTVTPSSTISPTAPASILSPTVSPTNSSPTPISTATAPISTTIDTTAVPFSTFFTEFIAVLIVVLIISISLLLFRRHRKISKLIK